MLERVGRQGFTSTTDRNILVGRITPIKQGFSRKLTVYGQSPLKPCFFSPLLRQEVSTMGTEHRAEVFSPLYSRVEFFGNSQGKLRFILDSPIFTVG